MGMCILVSMERVINMAKEEWFMQIRMFMMAFGLRINSRKGLLLKLNENEITNNN